MGAFWQKICYASTPVISLVFTFEKAKQEETKNVVCKCRFTSLYKMDNEVMSEARLKQKMILKSISWLKLLIKLCCLNESMKERSLRILNQVRQARLTYVGISHRFDFFKLSLFYRCKDWKKLKILHKLSSFPLFHLIFISQKNSWPKSKQKHSPFTFGK